MKLDDTARAQLAEIGMQLDQNRYPVVCNSGIIRPSSPAVSSQPQGEVIKDEYAERTRRPATQSRQGPPRGPRTPGRSRSPGQASPLIDPGIERQYVSELDAVGNAYPGLRVWRRKKGMWLRTESELIHGLPRKATFLTAIPFIRNTRVFSWGYWTNALEATWIGPRHTNFTEGSICAFEPKDGTWSVGDSILELLDLYTLWALRHLHLSVFKRWPGQQSVPWPYERLIELRDDEFCGCPNSHLKYGECCKASDLSLDRDIEAKRFFAHTNGSMRKPPDVVVEIIRGLHEPPEIEPEFLPA